MSDEHSGLLSRLEEALTVQRYNRVVVQNYCCYARAFLCDLRARDVALTAVTPDHVSRYLRAATRRFRDRRGRAPGPTWASIPRSGIHALLRMALGQWPPVPEAQGSGAMLRHAICLAYETSLREDRGLSRACVAALMWEARHFLTWYLERSAATELAALSIQDVDRYLDQRSPGLRRKSLKDVVERLRSLLRYLHGKALVPINLAPQVIAPMLYAYESIPSTLHRDQIDVVLKVTRQDRSPIGLRDYAILQLLATYGLRVGEITHLRLEDIDWRADALRVHHSKTGARSVLPLMAPVGEALLDYLRGGRPQTDHRVVFLRARAPYRPLQCIYSDLRRRLHAAGVEPPGKCGPHIFRHARAVELLRASVPQKIIGDLLGHRSTEATNSYLKLATEDLRVVALDVPGREVLS